MKRPLRPNRAELHLTNGSLLLLDISSIRDRLQGLSLLHCFRLLILTSFKCRLGVAHLFLVVLQWANLFFILLLTTDWNSNRLLKWRFFGIIDWNFDTHLIALGPSLSLLWLVVLDQSGESSRDRNGRIVILIPRRFSVPLNEADFYWFAAIESGDLFELTWWSWSFPGTRRSPRCWFQKLRVHGGCRWDLWDRQRTVWRLETRSWPAMDWLSRLDPPSGWPAVLEPSRQFYRALIPRQPSCHQFLGLCF